MIDAARLTAAMHDQLLIRSESGPTANKPGPQPKPRASGIATGCTRALYYALIAAPREPRLPHSASATQMGSDLEAGILADFLAALDPFPSLAEHQVRVETEWFTGSADLVLTYPDERKVVVDSKTANRDSFEIKKREGMSPEHRTQLSLYAHALGADTIIVVLRNTDPRPMRGKPAMPVYHVQIARRDDAAVAKAKAIALAAMAARDANDEGAAARGFEASAWQCRYCDFSSHCRRPGAR